MFTVKNMRFLAAVVAALTLSSCSFLRTDYERTDQVVIPDNWQGDKEFQSVMRDPEGSWWKDFQDPELDSLINFGIEGSTSIKKAALDLKRYALLADLADTNLLPTPTARMSSGETWRHNNTKERSSSASLGISYEVDLFGRLKALRDVDRFAYEASREDFLAVKLTLTYEIAQLYWQIAYYNDALRFERENEQDYVKLVKLAEIRHDAGDISLYDLNKTKEQHLTSRNNIIDYENKLLQSTNALLVLLSEDELQKLPVDLAGITLDGKVSPEIMPGIPADILSNRPDLASAEYSLKSKLASYDVKRLNFFPELTLTGTAGTSSEDLLRFFDNPALSLLGSLTMPFFNFETLSLNRDVSLAEYEKAVLEFENTLRESLFEVKELLKELEGGREQLKNSNERVVLVKQNDEHYRLRYDEGDMSYGDFLDNKRTLRSSILALYKLQQTQLTNSAELYKALGGAQQ